MSAQPPQPTSMADILAAIAVVTRNQQPAAPTVLAETGLAKHASTVIVAVILALCLWVGKTVSDLSSTTTQVATKLDLLQRTVTELQAGQSIATRDLGDVKATDAKQDARADAQEADIGRIKERVRMLEGQKPVVVPGGAPQP